MSEYDKCERLSRVEVRRIRRTTEAIRTAAVTVQRLVTDAIEDQILPRQFRVSIGVPDDGSTANIKVTCTGESNEDIARCTEAATVLQDKGCACSSIEGGTQCECP